MASALEDEMLSINAIYESDTFTPASGSETYVLKIPYTDTALRMAFPVTYPEDSPAILGPEFTGANLRKGAAQDMASLAQEILATTFIAGEPCIFNLVQQMMEQMPAEVQESATDATKESLQEDSAASAVSEEASDNIFNSVEPKWTLSEVICEKKSVFLARAASVSNLEEAKLFVQHLVATDKKVSKATHNISAWRISEPNSRGVSYQDCDDDGENAAGGRLLHLLQTMDVWNVVVVVSRWYGGVHLGPDRFRCISNAARDALVKGAFHERVSASR